ncbi:MAG: hypothetical protein L0Y64_18470 [Myxococcaceae bacterium]|nr:hypothetical protein [Myxococcaceae bacterium]
MNESALIRNAAVAAMFAATAAVAQDHIVVDPVVTQTTTISLGIYNHNLETGGDFDRYNAFAQMVVDNASIRPADLLLLNEMFSEPFNWWFKKVHATQLCLTCDVHGHVPSGECIAHRLSHFSPTVFPNLSVSAQGEIAILAPTPKLQHVSGSHVECWIENEWDPTSAVRIASGERFRIVGTSQTLPVWSVHLNTNGPHDNYLTDLRN